MEGDDIGDLDIVEGDETSLKIPKRSSESVNRRRTDNTMAKRKRTNNDLQNTHIKLKFKLDEPH